MHDNLSIFVKYIEPYISPFFLIILSICIFLLVAQTQFKRTTKFFIFLFIFILLALSSSWLPSRLYFLFSSKYPVIHHAHANIKWIVVLGGGHHFVPNAPANHTLSTATTSRLIEGIRIYRQIPTATLILSGGFFLAKNTKDTDAFQMAQLTQWFNVPREHIILESYSINTIEEARAIKNWIKQDPFYLVTSAAHMRRSMFLFEREGLHPIAAPADYPYETNKPWITRLSFDPQNWCLINSLWHEHIGMWWEKFRYYKS